MDYYSDIQINEKQAKMFAESIFADISDMSKTTKKNITLSYRKRLYSICKWKGERK